MSRLSLFGFLTAFCTATLIAPAGFAQEVKKKEETEKKEEAKTVVHEQIRHIRAAILPREISLACSSPEGSVIIGNEIIVCSERDEKFKYRVPSARDEELANPKRYSPIEQAKTTLKSAGDTAPTGSNVGRTPVTGNVFALFSLIGTLLSGNKPDKKEDDLPPR